MYMVDGNNVMGQRVGWHRDKPAAQRRLLRELARWSRREDETVTVVFDGRPLAGVEDGASLDGVQVSFARPGSDADERIIELAELARHAAEPQGCVAVTSDKRLRERLQSLGIPVFRSGEFRKMLDSLP